MKPSIVFPETPKENRQIFENNGIEKILTFWCGQSDSNMELYEDIIQLILCFYEKNDFFWLSAKESSIKEVEEVFEYAVRDWLRSNFCKMRNGEEFESGMLTFDSVMTGQGGGGLWGLLNNCILL